MKLCLSSILLASLIVGVAAADDTHPIIDSKLQEIDPVIGAWDLRVPQLSEDDPTRFIVTFSPGNIVHIQQAFGDRSSASGHWNIKGEGNEAIYDKVGQVGTDYRFQDSHFRYDLNSPLLEVNGIEEHLVNLQYTASDTLVGDARITMYELDGDVESTFDVDLVATRLPYPSFDQSFSPSSAPGVPEPALGISMLLITIASIRAWIR